MVARLHKWNFEKFDVIASTSLASDVPVVYASRVDFNFLAPPVAKRSDVLAVAFVSNCAPRNGRNVFIEQLRQAGLTVHS